MLPGDRYNVAAKLGWVGLGHIDILPAKTNLHRLGVKQTGGSPNVRLVAGHWEGDLIVGTASGSAIATLVERTTRFVLLVHLPNGHSSAELHDGRIGAVDALPVLLRRSLTWAQGPELARHVDITTATGVPIFFCDPASPWQRGSNENTNGLLRQYFPKGTDLNAHSAQRLLEVATELNERPR